MAVRTLLEEILARIIMLLAWPHYRDQQKIPTPTYHPELIVPSWAAQGPKKQNINGHKEISVPFVNHNRCNDRNRAFAGFLSVQRTWLFNSLPIKRAPALEYSAL
jgi:hypothetical protein